jgi:hypothetical protein
MYLEKSFKKCKIVVDKLAVLRYFCTNLYSTPYATL